MSSFIPQQSQIANGLSIAGLALVSLSTYYRRSYSRTLEVVQMAYLFGLVLAPTSSLFANKLGYSWLSFMPTFLNYCTIGDFSCNYGYLLSPSICWAGAAILFFVIIKIIGRCKPSVKFQPFYNLYKGLLRWTFAPMVYFATDSLITSLKTNTKDKEFLAAVVVLGYFLAVALLQLMAYSCLPSKMKMTKWNQFFDHLRMAAMVSLICVSSRIYGNAKYALYGPIVVFDLLYLFTYNFVYKILERILFILSQAAFITLYTLFLTNSAYIAAYNIDFFACALILLIELLLVLMRICYRCNHQTEDTSEINPQDPGVHDSPRRDVSSPAKKNNRFIADADLGGNLSYEDLNSLGSSPRKELNKEKKRR